MPPRPTPMCRARSAERTVRELDHLKRFAAMEATARRFVEEQIRVSTGEFETAYRGLLELLTQNVTAVHRRADSRAGRSLLC